MICYPKKSAISDLSRLITMLSDLSTLITMLSDLSTLITIRAPDKLRICVFYARTWISVLLSARVLPDNFQVQRVITPYFWKWWVFAYFLCTVVLSSSEKIAYMYTFKIIQWLQQKVFSIVCAAKTDGRRQTPRDDQCSFDPLGSGEIKFYFKQFCISSSFHNLSIRKG
jgi:hypothetical protein